MTLKHTYGRVLGVLGLLPDYVDKEYTPHLREFEKRVSECTAEWNTTGFGYTIEFSTSDVDFQKKVWILEDYSQRLSLGTWRMYPCVTCKGYNEESHIHVFIDHCMDLDDQRKAHLETYFLVKRVKELENKGNAIIPIETLEELVSTIDQSSDLYRESTFLLDKAREEQETLSHIRYYKD